MGASIACYFAGAFLSESLPSRCLTESNRLEKSAL